jgi:sulfonate transport system substrate-binding protein
MMKMIIRGIIFGILSAALAVPSMAQDQNPQRIHIGLGGNPYNKPFISGAFGYAQEQALFDREFAKEGIKVQYHFFKGFGPASNEALANGSIDFAAYGDLCGVVSKAAGLKIHVLAIMGGAGDTYIIAPVDSPVHSFDDLKGRRIALPKGTYMDLSFNRILKDKGLKESDFKIFNLTAIDGLAAVASGAVEAQIGSYASLDLVNRGCAKLIYSTADENSPGDYKSFSEIVVREEFESKYPDVVRRVIKVIVQANSYLADEAHRETAIRLTEKTGVPALLARQELGNKSLRWVYGLSVDPDAIARLKTTVAFAKERGIIRNDIDVDQWVRPQYLRKAYQDLGIEDQWFLPKEKHYIKVRKM